MRAFDDAVFADAKSRLESLAGPSPAVPGATITVENIGETAPWPGDQQTAQLFQTFATTAASLGYSVKGERRGGLSDANYLHTLGPTLDGLGPSGGNAHCSERSIDGTKTPEFVEPASLVPKAALTVLALSAMKSTQPD
jgi:glutamate carboxypeptidase